MPAGVLGAAALGIEEGDAGRVGAAPGPVVARERPEPAGLGAAAARIEHRGAGLVGEEPGRCLQDLDQPGMDRAELARRMADPVGERRAVERQPLAGEDLRLAVERQVVGVFADEHMRDHRLGRQPSGDQPGRGRRLHDALGAAPAGVSRPARDEHLELRRDDVEPLGDVLADADGAPPPQHGQSRLSGSMTLSTRGRCFGSAPRLARRRWPRVLFSAASAASCPALSSAISCSASSSASSSWPGSSFSERRPNIARLKASTMAVSRATSSARSSRAPRSATSIAFSAAASSGRAAGSRRAAASLMPA